MEYADVVLASIVAVFPVSIAVLVSLGLSQHAAIAGGSLLATVLVLHATLFNPPGPGRSS